MNTGQLIHQRYSHYYVFSYLTSLTHLQLCDRVTAKERICKKIQQSANTYHTQYDESLLKLRSMHQIK